MSTESQNTRWGQLIIEELVRQGVCHFCVSPGSRSTPLTHAIATNSHAKSTVFTDERSAAFFALGVARATGRPAAMITTSGTAMLNATPAIAEADVARVPFLLLSADRPPELRDSGANQTIPQPYTFGSRVRWQGDLPCPTPEISGAAVLSIIGMTVSRTLGDSPGPVHLNCMFREPLGPVQMPALENRLSDWSATRHPWTQHQHGLKCLAQSDIEALARTLSETQRGLVVIGAIDDPSERNAALQIAQQLQWPVYADITSGLRTCRTLRWQVSAMDPLLGSPDFQNSFRSTPLDCLLWFGGPTISKRFLNELSAHPPRRHLVIRPDLHRQDPRHTVTDRLHAHLTMLAPVLCPLVQTQVDHQWRDHLFSCSTIAKKAADTFVTSQPSLTEPGVSKILSESEPNALFVGNSMPIRDLDAHATGRDTPLLIGANRGASGIDGLVATAAGWACGHQVPVTAVLGDLSTLHDLSSLAQLASFPQPVRLVVINNGGGGIFSFLPVAAMSAGFEPFFATAHEQSLAPIAAALNLPVYAPSSPDELKSVLDETQGISCLIEVKTDRTENLAVHKQRQAIIHAAIATHLEKP